MRKCRIGTANFFTLLLLLYHTSVKVAGFEQAFHGDMILNAGVLEEISNSMSNISEISLPFEYDDLKYIIVKTRADFEKLTCEISDLADDIQHELISKVVIWDVSRRDF